MAETPSETASTVGSPSKPVSAGSVESAGSRPVEPQFGRPQFVEPLLPDSTTGGDPDGSDTPADRATVAGTDTDRGDATASTAGVPSSSGPAPDPAPVAMPRFSDG